jgi:hypothetical protein
MADDNSVAVDRQLLFTTDQVAQACFQFVRDSLCPNCEAAATWRFADGRLVELECTNNCMRAKVADAIRARQPPNILEWALFYASKGFLVFPLHWPRLNSSTVEGKRWNRDNH